MLGEQFQIRGELICQSQQKNMKPTLFLEYCAILKSKEYFKAISSKSLDFLFLCEASWRQTYCSTSSFLSVLRAAVGEFMSQ